MSLAYFALSSLDLLGAMDELEDGTRREYIDWIYAQQLPSGGFRGGPFVGLPAHAEEPPHIVMSYTALLTLAILGDDLTRLDFRGLLDFVVACQTDDGSFSPYPGSAERDVRFVYCAFVLCNLFKAFDRIDLAAALRYLERCRSYDYGYGQRPGLEPQGGTTYCCLAAFQLAGSRPDPKAELRTLDWLCHRQVALDPALLDEDDFSGEQEHTLLLQLESGEKQILGFQGRPEKDPDACYSFWMTASMQLLAPDGRRTDSGQGDSSFLLLCQMPRMGGIAKFPGEYPDLYHTYLALAALALGGDHGLRALDPAINLSKDALVSLEARISAML